MREATIPADGEWHDLPERPVSTIHAPGFMVEIDIEKGGTGRVRNRGPREITVEYGVRKHG